MNRSRCLVINQDLILYIKKIIARGRFIYFTIKTSKRLKLFSIFIKEMRNNKNRSVNIVLHEAFFSHCKISFDMVDAQKRFQEISSRAFCKTDEFTRKSLPSVGRLD